MIRDTLLNILELKKKILILLQTVYLSREVKYRLDENTLCILGPKCFIFKLHYFSSIHY